MRDRETRYSADKIASRHKLLTENAGDIDSGQTIASVERAADVLMLFTRTKSNTLGVTEVANDLALSKAAVHRILTSLRSRGLVELDASTRRYFLGPVSMILGLRYMERLNVRNLALPGLRELSAATNETATLSVRMGNVRVYIEQVTPSREVIMSVSLGVAFPLHAGASSKAFLAFLPDGELAAYLRSKLIALTVNTVTDPVALKEELSGVRERGWARSSGERQSGAASVAAPVFDHLGTPVAVISVCGPVERFAQEAGECAERLLTITQSISRKMGYLAG